MKIIIGLLLIGANCIAQNYATNQVYTGCREVDGKAYFPPKSVLWEDVRGTCERIEDDGILLKLSYVETEVISPPLYQALPARRDIFGRRSNPRRTMVQEGQTKEHVVNRSVFVNNYKAKTAVGATVTVSAMQVGKRKGVELWDCGTPIMKTTVRRVK